MSARFSTLIERYGKGGPKTFEAGSLPDDEKERLCRSLLAEFGVNKINVTNKGEMIHSCALPWHEDRNPSASLNYKKLTYNCLSCGSSGGLLWFIGSCRGGTADEAKRWIGEQTGLGADGPSLAMLLDIIDSIYGEKDNYVPPIPRMDESLLKPWLFIHPWLTERRGVPEENIVRLKIGYGVIPIRMDDGSWQDSHRIVLPHIWKGSLCGWQTRRLVLDGTPKYKSSADFPKDVTIYNFDARAPLAVVVESPMSTARHIHHQHFEGTFGAKVTDKQCRLLSNHPRIVLWMDNDEAGWKATHRVAEALLPYSMVDVVESPWAADAGDLPDDVVDDLVASAVPYALWRPPTELKPWASPST